MTWTTACPDWERRLLARESLIPFPPLFPDEAAASLSVFSALRMVDVLGSPLLGEIARPWVADFVSCLFGSYDSDTGRRLIQEYFLCVSKKNGKSSLAAGIMMTALIRNWRKSAEFIIIAPTVEIANNSFQPAMDMVKADEELSLLFHVQPHYRTITHRVTGATLKVIAADNETVGGKKGAGILIDEAWLFGKRPNAENMLREATGGLASRPEGFIIYLSTQSDETPTGVFHQKLQYARGVRDGRIDDKRFLPMIYEFPPDMIKAGAHLLPENFYVTNPNLGSSVDEEFLSRELSKAQEAGQESLRGFLAKHLNVEIGLALQSNNWAGALFWEDQGDRTLTLDELLRRSEVVTVGIDGGGLDDLLGLAVTGKEKGTGRWLHWGKAWAHKIVLERRKSESERFKQFAREGDLTFVDRPGEDVTQLVEIVKRCEKSGLLSQIGVDRAGINAIVDAIVLALKLPEDNQRIVAIPQGWGLMSSIQSAERKLAEGALVHQGSSMMAWCVGNARIEAKGNAIYVTKQVSGRAKIDPLMALFDALTLLPNAKPAPKYQMIRLR